MSLAWSHRNSRATKPKMRKEEEQWSGGKGRPTPQYSTKDFKAAKRKKERERGGTLKNIYRDQWWQIWFIEVLSSCAAGRVLVHTLLHNSRIQQDLRYRCTCGPCKSNSPPYHWQLVELVLLDCQRLGNLNARLNKCSSVHTSHLTA